MHYQFPPDVEKLVREQMAISGYRSADDLLRDALNLFRELSARQEQLRADVQLGIEQADQGLARLLDLNALIDRCATKLAEDGVGD